MCMWSCLVYSSQNTPNSDFFFLLFASLFMCILNFWLFSSFPEKRNKIFFSFILASISGVNFNYFLSLFSHFNPDLLSDCKSKRKIADLLACIICMTLNYFLLILHFILYPRTWFEILFIYFSSFSLYDFPLPLAIVS